MSETGEMTAEGAVRKQRLDPRAAARLFVVLGLAAAVVAMLVAVRTGAIARDEWCSYGFSQ